VVFRACASIAPYVGRGLQTPPTRWSDIWLTQGYALVYPDIPILGKDGKFNDNYRPHLVDTIYSAIRKLDEMGYIGDLYRTLDDETANALSAAVAAHRRSRRGRVAELRDPWAC
jgi:hypothetical protein